MSLLSPLLDKQRGAQRRLALETTVIGLPGVLALAAVGWRLFSLTVAVIVGLLTLGLLAVFVIRRIRQFDSHWLIRELDAKIPRFEDSSALLFQDRSSLSGLAVLQRHRLEERLTEANRIDLRPPWSRRRISWAWGVGAVVIAASVAWPPPTPSPPTGPENPAIVSSPGAPQITGARLRIIPPAYTGLAARDEKELDVRVPVGSRVEWVIDIAPRPDQAALVFPENGRMALSPDRRRWTASRIIDQSMLYRIEAEGMARQRLHRIDAVADAPPAVRLISPESQLVTAQRGQTDWTPVFEASDDYGVATNATLRITVTKGDGENITYEQRSMTLEGRGEARRKRYSTTLDLAREGMAPGSDLIVQLVVRDNRAPHSQEVEGPSVILRWPTDLALADGLDGLMQPVLPAYFSSQRQIIIDAEALIADRAALAPDRFMSRSNALGADQAQLRMRYGQFMGEEAEGDGGGGIALPTNDAPARPALPTNDAPSPAAAPPAAAGHDDHDHGADSRVDGFGSAVDAVREFGHAHDDSDAATLFDPGTRSTLSQALDAMWSSERALRQGRPEDALPHAHRALEFLKEAQQATRVFLARTSSNLPPVDMSRRLTGKRDGIVADYLDPPPARPYDRSLADAWRALEQRPGAVSPDSRSLAALEAWVRSNGARLSDPLALTVAIDTVRHEPECTDCRQALRALLWQAADQPPASVRRRPAPATRGQRYLDALR